MTEGDHRKWDIVIKAIVTPLLAILTVLIGIYQYTDGQKRTIEREYQLRLVEREEQYFHEKKEIYREASQILAFLASHRKPDSQLYKARELRFWELYWGALASVESKDIEKLMVKFGRGLSSISELKDSSRLEKVRNELELVSLEFARQIQTELSQ